MKTNICCGCSACAVICPMKAIKMEINEDGFYRPKIDKNKCIDCKICEKACIYKSKNDSDIKDLACCGFYAGNTKNKEIRETTSSGGIAFEIAKYGIKNDFVICGVEYDKDNRIARHILIDNKTSELLENLKGSKYLASMNYDAFDKIIRSAKKNIVFGTPCQIAGLYKILSLKDKLEKFILIEVFCYGIPSYNLWSKYIKYIIKKYKLSDNPNVTFRDKKKGWHDYFIKIESDEKKYENIRDLDVFYQYFLNAKCYSKSCYNCKFRNKTYADIRLGDYWGKKFENSELGHSMIAVNTKKGLKLLKDLNIDLTIEDKNDRESQETGIIDFPDDYEFVREMLKDENFELEKYISNIIKKNQLRLIKRKIKKVIKGKR